MQRKAPCHGLEGRDAQASSLIWSLQDWQRPHTAQASRTMTRRWQGCGKEVMALKLQEAQAPGHDK